MNINSTTATQAYQSAASQPAQSNSGEQAQSRPPGFDTEDKVSISQEGAELARQQEQANATGETELTEAEKEEVRKLQQRDQEVRAHEAAHVAAGAGVVKSGASFSYTQGPDGKKYATGGEVKVDTSRESDPEATVAKMQQVKRAALAPASPSGQDRAVAAKAARNIVEARAEMRTETSETPGALEPGSENSESTEQIPGDQPESQNPTKENSTPIVE